MKKWKYPLIAAVILGSFWVLYPTVQFYSMTPAERAALPKEDREKYHDSAMKLGLDLQGGMHLVVEIDDTKLDGDARKDALDRVIRTLRNRVDQFGVAEPIIQKQGDHRVIVQLPGLQDPDRAKSLIGRTALLEFRLVREDDEIRRALTDLDNALKGVAVEGAAGSEESAEPAAADQTDAELAMNSDTQGDTASGQNETTPFDTLLPTLPGTDGVEMPLREISKDKPFSSYLISMVNGAVVVDERNKDIVDRLLAAPQALAVIPRQSEFLWDEEARPIEGGGIGRLLYLVEKTPTLTGAHLVNSTTRPDPDDPSTLNVGFTLDREGGILFGRFTGDNIGRRIAIVLDKKIASAPVVQSKIPGGEGRITGNFTDEEAGDLAIVLRAGALPAPVKIIEERTVGPTLGRDSIVLGVRAAIYGFIAVVLFMVIYYKLSGLLACTALVLNLIILLAVLVKLGASLTLPGIAGLILTIGMSVDANVLVFERIREELAKAKTVRSAIDAGYDRAFSAILDSNVTTLITGLVLWQFGTGPIKGFATTLCIGLIANMFTALMCTRVVYDFVTTRWQLRKLSI
jgi:protein-export membrane protein SecD